MEQKLPLKNCSSSPFKTPKSQKYLQHIQNTFLSECSSPVRSLIDSYTLPDLTLLTKKLCQRDPFAEAQPSLHKIKIASPSPQSFKVIPKKKPFILNFRQMKEERKGRKTAFNLSLNETQRNRIKSKKVIFAKREKDYSVLAFCRNQLRHKSHIEISKQKLLLLFCEFKSLFEKNQKVFKDDINDLSILSADFIQNLESGEKNGIRPPKLKTRGNFSCLILYIVQELLCRKGKEKNRVDINKQIQLYSRRLNFHKLTLRICFDIGDLYKERKDEENCAYYYSKALKQAIFIGDTYSEEKAIDNLGLISYLSGKIEGASYCHNNIEAIKDYERNMIAEQFSNQKQIQKLYNQKKYKINPNNKKNISVVELSSSSYKNYPFLHGHIKGTFDNQNKQKFKQSIKQYIQCPLMRRKTIVASSKINRIKLIGKVKDYSKSKKTEKNYPLSLEENCKSYEVMLTHRSMNRYIDPEQQSFSQEKKMMISFLKCLTYENEKFNI